MRKRVLLFALVCSLLIGNIVSVGAATYVTGSEIYDTLSEKLGVPRQEIREYLLNNVYLFKAQTDILDGDSMIPEGFVWYVLAPIYGFYPVPQSLCQPYPASWKEGWSENFRDLFASMSEAGLVNASWQPARACTTDQFSVIKMALEDGEWGSLPAVYSPYTPNTEINALTWRGRNAIYKAANTLGQSSMEAIMKGGWTFRIDADVVMSHEFGNVSGLTQSKDSLIWIWDNTAYTVYHEFGHVLARRHLDDAETRKVYLEEAPSTVGLLRDYGRKDENEYIAEVVSAFLAQDYDVTMALQVLCPKTYTMVKDMISPYVVFIEPQTSDEFPFIDVPQLSPYYDAIKWTYGMSYMMGTDNTHFSPDTHTTRAQAVSVLYRMKGIISDVSLPFGDVPEDAWYSDALRWAYSTGVVSGTSETTFSPDNYITQEQFVKMCYDLYGVPVNGADFGIMGASSWAKQAWNWAYRNDIVSGDNPQRVLTRAEMAQVLVSIPY